MTEDSLFEILLKVPAGERGRLLGLLAGADSALKAGVEELLDAHAAAEAVLGAVGDRPKREESGDRAGVSLGRFTLEKPIGEGGMGSVWIAKQNEPVRRRVALKLIKGGLESRSVIRRFEAERQALAIMDHPNIARVFDGGLLPDGRPFLAMEYVHGSPIIAHCDAAKLDVRGRLALFVKVCHAIQHAHQKGIIHRDLKPANVLVTTIDGQAEPKVIDFGLARLVGAGMREPGDTTQFGAVVGTLEHMAPEQAAFSGTDIDTRADVYSLGVLLYELLTGMRPFDSQRIKRSAFDEAIRMIREEEPSRPSARLLSSETLAQAAEARDAEPPKLIGAVRGDLDWIVMKCLEKDRERRFESAHALAADVLRHLEHQPVEARPPSVRDRSFKFLRRHRVAVSAGLAVAFSLIAGTFAATWGLIRAERLRVVAERNEREARESALAEAAARRAESEALKKEQRERLHAEAIANFVSEDFLGMTTVEGQNRFAYGARGLGREATLQQLLDRAHFKLNLRKDLDPVIEGKLRWIIGISYRSLSVPELAISNLERCLRLRTEALGPDHRDTLEALNSLAVAYNSADRLDKAIPLFERAAEAMTRQLGPDHRDTLTALHNLSKCHQDREDTGKAIPLQEAILERRRRVLGANDVDTLISMDGLATSYRIAGRVEEAIKLYQDCLERRRKVLGPEHLDTVGGINNLGVALQVMKRFDEAVPLFESVLAQQRKRLGDDHGSTMTTKFNLATTLMAMGRRDRALPLYEELFASIQRSRFRNPMSQRVSANAVRAAEAAQQYRKAEQWRRTWMVVVRGQYGERSKEVAAEIIGIGTNLIAQRRWPEAMAEFDASLAITRAIAPRTLPEFAALGYRGMALFGQGRHQEAERDLAAAYRGMTETPGLNLAPMANEIIPLLDRLIEVNGLLNRPTEVERYKAEKAKRIASRAAAAPKPGAPVSPAAKDAFTGPEPPTPRKGS
jgi:serine/threonine protein kinase